MRTRAGLALAAALAGCMTPPARQDPFASLGAGGAPAAHKDLDLAVVLSPNSLEAAAYLEKTRSNVFLKGRIREEMGSVFPGLMGMLSHQFRSVARARTLEEAKASSADAVALLDVYVKLGWRTGAMTTVEQKLVFLRRDGAELDSFAGRGEKKVPWPMVTTLVGEAAAEALAQTSAALVASAPLKALARAKVGAGAAAPAPQAAPIPAPVSEVDKPGYAFPESPESFALVIGVERYESLPPAAHAERDAAAVRAHLSALGTPERNLVFLTGSRAGRAGIEKYVESWLPRNVGPEAMVFVYFSGHGAPDPRTGQAYLVPFDGDPSFLENTGYPIKRLYEKLNALPAKRVVVAMDACFSGAGGRSVLAKGLRPLVSQVDAAASSAGRLVVLAASGPDEVTGTDESQGHGLFTYHLLKGLNAGKGAVSAAELFDYLRPKVQDAARRDNRDQTPRLLAAESAARGPFFSRPRRD